MALGADAYLDQRRGVLMSLEKRKRDTTRSASTTASELNLSRRKVRELQKIEGPWISITRELLRSPLWREMSRAARLCLDRIMLEHLEHAGTRNGDLIVTYKDFKNYKVRKESVAEALDALEFAGFIRVTRGKFESADRRKPNKFTLTWLRVGVLKATHDYRKRTVEELRHHLAVNRARRARVRARRERHTS